jgi:hypothetical protein
LIGLPDPKLLAAHPGFQPLEERELPKRPKLLMGDAEEFRKQFPRAM